MGEPHAPEITPGAPVAAATAETAADPSRPAAARPAASVGLLGLSLKHFDVQGLLGRGGGGDVYLAHDSSLDRQVALKVLAPEIAHDPALIARFVREARAQARLQHPNVTQIYFIGEDAGAHFFAMEYLPGGSVGARLDGGGKLPWPEALEHTIAAAQGLRAAFREGFVHRDVKPSNLLLGKHGELKVADFGLVKRLDEDVGLTQKGAVLGTPLYMAPEQGRSEVADHRSDIYSLGCTLYHMVAGAPPFQAPTAVGVISMHASDRARPLRARAAEVPPQLDAIVARMMAKDPAERYQTYDEVIAALEAARPGRQLYGGFVVRAAAAMLDWLLILLVPARGWGLLVALVYFTLWHRLLGFTPGKWLFRLHVTEPDGKRLSWWRALARTAAYLWGPAALKLLAWLFRHTGVTPADGFNFQFGSHAASQPASAAAGASAGTAVAVGVAFGCVALLYVGTLLVAALHPRKRALHDLLAGTQVTYRFQGEAPKG